MLEQCNKSSDAGVGGPGSAESDLGCIDVQGQHCISVLNVSTKLLCIHSMQSTIVNTSYSIVAIVLAFLCFLLLATFPGWHEETNDDGSEIRDVKPFPSRPVSQVSLALIFVASIFVLVSVLWQHTASVAASTIAQDLGNGSVKSGVGTTAMVLGWFGFSLLIVVTIGLLVMILSIQLFDRLTDD